MKNGSSLTEEVKTQNYVRLQVLCLEAEPPADSEFLSFFVLCSRLLADLLSHLGKWVKLIKFEAERECFCTCKVEKPQGTTSTWSCGSDFKKSDKIGFKKSDKKIYLIFFCSCGHFKMCLTYVGPLVPEL